MLMNEVAELMKNTNVYEIAAKTNRKINLTDDEKTVAAQFDEWARKIGESGHDSDHQIAAFITRTVRDEFYNAPSEILDFMFDRGSVGEFDDYQAMVDPIKNTLVAYEAAQGGNVPRSYLDISALTPVWKNRQVESELSFVDMRRNGWKSVALLTEYAIQALENAMFADIFGAVNSAIGSGAPNYIVESTTLPTQTSMDAMALYLNDRAPGNSIIVGASKYIQAASKLTGYNSEEMLNEIHRTGRLGMYDGCDMYPISSAKLSATGALYLPD